MDRFLRYIFFFLASFRKAPWDTGISPPELKTFISSHTLGRALDLGCGTGTNVITLAQSGWQVTGVDFIPRSIERARQKARSAGIKADFIVESVARLEGITGPFDLIFDVGCYQGLIFSDRSAYQKNIQRLLAPGGSFLIYGFLHDPENGMNYGLTSEDIAAFESFLLLKNRQDSPGNRGRASTWLLYERE